MALRYRLDDLGWYQFEWLVQSLLKARLSLTIESWGGSGDYGRDAFFEGALVLGSNEGPTLGPHLFQAKFIDGASSAGARAIPQLLSAVAKEVDRIERRRTREEWIEPAHYFLITNAPLSSRARGQVSEALTEALPQSQLHQWSGADVCDFLDLYPALRRAFPQLLSLRDLDSLLSNVVNREVLARSRIALEMAKPLISSFVPTEPYEKTLDTLSRHSFAVLEGPPEMGKSAIAWMIGLTQLASGWDVVNCERPDDFFGLYDQGRPQVFISDDAFGRTEYDPQRGSVWEKDLERVLHMLGNKHWLIWTTRKHILERALRTLDLEGRAANFPAPGAVLVDATKLSIREKALILYRHAKTSSMAPERKLVKKFAVQIVNHPAFTPERIKAFIEDPLPELARDSDAGRLDPQQVQAAVSECIRNPTARMRKTYERLPISHRWYLIAMLECGHWPIVEEVRRRYVELCPVDVQHASFETVDDEMSESFSRKLPDLFGLGQHLAWLHPSYRDLVIEQLSADGTLRKRFLKVASPSGIKLALSESGGATGQRQCPLVVDAGDMALIRQRIEELVHSEPVEDVCDVLNAVLDAIESARSDQLIVGLRETLAASCVEARTHWDAHAMSLNADQLRTFANCTMALDPMPAMPDLSASWGSAEQLLERTIEGFKTLEELDVEAVTEWSKFVAAVSETEPRTLRRNGFPDDYLAGLDALVAGVKMTLLDTEVDDEELRAHADQCTTTVVALKRIGELVPGMRASLVDLCNRLAARADRLADRADETEGPDDDYSPEAAAQGFNVGELFSDLV